MKRAAPKKAAVPAAPSAPRPLGEVLRASLSYVASGGGGGGLVLDAAECRDILNALEHAGQTASAARTTPAAIAQANEADRLRRQFNDLLALVSKLADTFGERKAVPGQVLVGLDVQAHAIRDDGGAP
ncbi:MAG: hypothetical protein EOO71_08955 [Myxococcaceae bacterium]|nr:MAG: hypothetical protein EOO71_08955 [Myxococcaceae bacterium]